jgi:hypothetical protein
MPAPKGNNYWEFRNKHGRNHAYTPDDLWDEAVNYFEWMKDKVWNKKDPIKSGMAAGELIDIPTSTPMSIGSFCLFADIDESTFDNYLKAPGYEDFFRVTKQIKLIIESQQFEGATVGAFNPNIIARKLGLSDKLQTEHSGEIKGTTIIPMNPQQAKELLDNLDKNI